MNHIAQFLLKEVPKSKITNKRQFIISQFMEELDKESKKFPARFIAVKLADKNIRELEIFYSKCRHYELSGKGPFAKAFWGILKVDKKI